MIASSTSALYAAPRAPDGAGEVDDDLPGATELAGHQHRVDGPPHAAAVADVGMVPCGPHQGHGIAHQAVVALERSPSPLARCSTISRSRASSWYPTASRQRRS